uniref:Uncharacterized protein n=1 Tax=Arundo donax TaxID=35708 RepID=A0A0A9CXT1_ARUDO
MLRSPPSLLARFAAFISLQWLMNLVSSFSASMSLVNLFGLTTLFPLRTWGALPWRLGGMDLLFFCPLNRLCFCVISLLSDGSTEQPPQLCAVGRIRLKPD